MAWKKIQQKKKERNIFQIVWFNSGLKCQTTSEGTSTGSHFNRDIFFVVSGLHYFMETEGLTVFKLNA